MIITLLALVAVAALVLAVHAKLTHRTFKEEAQADLAALKAEVETLKDKLTKH